MAAHEGLQKAASPSESQLLKVEVPSVFLNVLPRAEEMQCLNVKRNSSCLPSFQVSLPSPAVLWEVLFRAQQPGSLGKKAPWRGKAASKTAPEHPQLLTCCSLDKYLEII